jgi:hypothetical protein
MARASLALLALLASAASAGATTPCNQFFVQKQYAYTQPVVAYAAPVVQYYAGQDIQAEALAEKVARLVDKKLELRLQQAQQVKAQPQTMLSQHCAKCHSGATPKAGLTYDGITPVTSELAIAALVAIKDESMPKDHKIDPSVKGQLMEELLSLGSRPREVPVQPVSQQPADVPPPAPVPQGQLQ